MSRKLGLTVLTCAVLCLGSATAAKADTVTFTGLMFGQNSYTEVGMTVSAGPGQGLFAANTGVGGSRNLALLLFNSVTFTFSGSTFNAQSIEVNVFPDNGPGFPPNEATFRAFNGTTLTGIITLTRVPGSPPPPLVLSFGAGFQGITSLVLQAPVIGGDIHVDNFTFQPAQVVIPEPTTMILLSTGLAGVAAKIRRRRKAITSEDVNSSKILTRTFTGSDGFRTAS